MRADAGSGTDGAADGRIPAPPIQLPPYMGRIVVTPAALLFTKAGEHATLRAEAFDATGAKVDATFTWESSRPLDAEVDATGQITSVAALGSSQIRARAGGLVSQPVLVLVAEPAVGAVLVSDAQVTSGPTPVDPAAAPGIGFQVTLTASGTSALTPGTILLASEGKPIGGRVVTAVPSATAGALDVVLEAVPLLDLFQRLNAEGNHVIDGAAMAEALAVPIEPTAFSPSPSPSLSPSTPSRSMRRARPSAQEDLAEAKFMLGPFECETKLVGGALTGDATLKLLPDMSLDYRFIKDADGNWSDLMVKLEGKLTAQATTTLSFSPMLAGSVSCAVTLVKLPFLIAGPLGAVVSFKIPLGIKGEITAVLATIPLEAGLELTGVSKVQLGFRYTPQAGVMDLGDFSNTFQLDPKFTYPENDTPFTALGSVALGGTAGLTVGITPLTLLGGGSLSLLEAALMMKASMKLGGTASQFSSPAFSSGYDIKPVLEVGAGDDTKKAMEWFGGAIALKPTVVVEGPALALSPRGMLKAEKTTVMPGEPVKLTVTLAPNSLSFLGVDNVADVRIYQSTPGSEFKLVKTIGASAGQASFAWTWNTSVTDVGTHRFWASANSRLAPGLPLEVADDSGIDVHVGKPVRIRWRGTVTCMDTGDRMESTLTSTLVETIRRTVTLQVEHESDLAAQSSGTMKITGMQAMYLNSTISDVTSGTTCPMQFHSESIQTSNKSAPGPGDLVVLTVDDIGGRYVLFAGGNLVQDIAMLTATSTVGGDPARCKVGTTTEVDPIAFGGSWSCGAIPMGMFAKDAEEISGGYTSTTDSPILPIKTVTQWTFERI